LAARKKKLTENHILSDFTQIFETVSGTQCPNTNITFSSKMHAAAERKKERNSFEKEIEKNCLTSNET